MIFIVSVDAIFTPYRNLFRRFMTIFASRGRCVTTTDDYRFAGLNGSRPHYHGRAVDTSADATAPHYAQF